MNPKSNPFVPLLPGHLAIIVFCISCATIRAAGWPGFINQSEALRTDIFSFTGSTAEAYDSNENYYDGDFADFDGDGQMDRALGARYGLLKNMGQGHMTPYAGVNLVNYLFRGLSPGWGEDAFQWADVDNDGDLDILQGGNGEPFTLQINAAGRFRTKWIKSSNASALNIVNIDLENDGDVDLVVAHAFCSDVRCGHGCPEEDCQGVGNWPKQFHLWINDGGGNFTEETLGRGFPVDFGTNLIVGVVAGDVDQDRDFDLLMINGIARGITLARNDGTGNFTLSLVPFAVALAPIRPIGHGFSQAMNLGDIDDDSDLDLVIALVRDSAGTSNPQVGHAVFINDGNGNFTDETATRFDTTEYTGTFLNGSNGKLADLDYDGDFDFLVFDSGTSRLLQIYVNDGFGVFRYRSDLSRVLPSGSSTGGTGADTDITDIDGDGTYDLWIGAAGSDVQILMNPYVPSDGLPANVPRDFTLESVNANGVTLSWRHPAFVDIARRYHVYRSTAPGLARQHSRLIKRVGMSRHQDEGFAAPLTRHTTTEYLNDPDVVLIGESNQVRFTDTAALPGVTYYYAVTHVGTENTESQPTLTLAAQMPSFGGQDVTAPMLDILRPTMEDWSVLPPIVIQFADGGSGVDMASLQVWFDVPLGTGQTESGGRPVGADISDSFLLKDNGVFIGQLPGSMSLPVNTLATLRASLSDQAGNSVTNQVSLFPTVLPNQSPTAIVSNSATNGTAPLEITFTGINSFDIDGKILSWEWYFEDGSTAMGSQVDRLFAGGGTHQVALLVRDASGATDMATATIALESLRILSAELDAGQFKFSFATSLGVTYTVERTDDLPPRNWETVDEIAGTGEIYEFSERISELPQSQHYFRVGIR